MKFFWFLIFVFGLNIAQANLEISGTF